MTTTHTTNKPWHYCFGESERTACGLNKISCVTVAEDWEVTCPECREQITRWLPKPAVVGVTV